MASGSRTTAPYRHVRDIASGGMGTVSLVVRREGTFARVYALKRLKSDLLGEGEVRAMFIEEARIAGLIRHANVVGVLDVGEDDEGAYLVMDFIEGISTSELIKRAARRREQIPAQVCVEIARQAAEGLRAAHELKGAGGKALNVVHRDVSPANIMLGFDGVARVTDFGVARALDASTQTRVGVVKGKRGYMSPEQIRCEPLDHRSDLFSLGIVIYELLKGGALYRGEASEVQRQTLQEPPPDIGELRDDLPGELVELLFDMMAKDVAERPSTTAEVAFKLARIGSNLSAQEDPVDLRSYIGEHFRAEQAAQHAVISAALEDRDTTVLSAMPFGRTDPSEESTSVLGDARAAPVPVDSSRGRSAMTLALAALVLSVALGGGALWVALSSTGESSTGESSTGESSTGESSTSESSQDEAGSSSSTSAPSQEATAPPPPPPVVEAFAEEVPTEPTAEAPPASDDVRPAPRPRGSNVRDRSMQDEPPAQSTPMIPSWQWE